MFKSYRWFYKDKNFINEIDKTKLIKFFNTSFDYQLGWEPLANSQKIESFGNGKKGLLKFDEFKRRSDPNRKLAFSDYAIFGDSFALSRQVNENETIAYFLGKSLKKYIPNYGVGNYGIDQAYLRYKKYKKKLEKKHIIYIVVPESIVRINTRWRHLHETGNTFGFKPKFEINNLQNITLLKNPIRNFSDYENIFNSFKEGKSELIDDPMFKLRFKEEAFNFSNLLGLRGATFYKLLELIEWRIKKNFLESISDKNGLTIRMKSNSRFTNKCYSNLETNRLFTKLILEINSVHKNKMSIFLVPQLSDFKINNYKREKYFENLRNNYNIKIFDATKFLIKEIGTKNNAESLYVEKGYGGHLNKNGNYLVANWIRSLI